MSSLSSFLTSLCLSRCLCLSASLSFSVFVSRSRSLDLQLACGQVAEATQRKVWESIVVAMQVLRISQGGKRVIGKKKPAPHAPRTSRRSAWTQEEEEEETLAPGANFTFDEVFDGARRQTTTDQRRSQGQSSRSSRKRTGMKKSRRGGRRPGHTHSRAPRNKRTRTQSRGVGRGDATESTTVESTLPRGGVNTLSSLKVGLIVLFGGTVIQLLCQAKVKSGGKSTRISSLLFDVDTIPQDFDPNKRAPPHIHIRRLKHFEAVFTEITTGMSCEDCGGAHLLWDVRAVHGWRNGCARFEIAEEARYHARP